MDVHKPGPWRGWRELAKEIGTIVVGVLIALGAEQAVEWLHWRHEVETERHALLSEVQDNLDAIQSRLAMQDCLDRRLADLKIVFERHANHQPLGIRGTVGLPLAAGGPRGTWSIAMSGQGLAHMPTSEQTDLSNAFANFENWDALRRDERMAWVKLGALDDASGIGEGDWPLLRQAYAEARAATARVAYVGPFILQTANLGQKPKVDAVAEENIRSAAKARQIDVMQICRPLL
jgi:hypothetical protein